jgi:carbamoyl-phosphate synthase large subunit
MIDNQLHFSNNYTIMSGDLDTIKYNIALGNTQRLRNIFAGFDKGLSAKDVCDLSNIHPWFCHKLKSFYNKNKTGDYSYFDKLESNFKMVDTCAGEFEAYTPFFYSTKKIDLAPEGNEATDDLYNTGKSNFDYLIDKAKKDERSLVLDAVLFNSFDKVFVQKRRSDRKFLPNCWGLVGGHFIRSQKRLGLKTAFDVLNGIIYEDTGWQLSEIKSVLEVRDWENDGAKMRTVVFEVEVQGNLDVPRLDLNKVKGFLWIDKDDLDIFKFNETYEENLMYKVCKKALELHKQPKKVIILGSGPIRIGQGVEFDYLTVHAVQALQKKGYKAIIINNNPETVSTDYSTSDRLYFEPLTPEFVARVVENEKEGLVGVIAQFGGQTAVNLARPLEEIGIKVLGTNANAIDLSEDRELTGELMAKLNYKMPKWDITYKKSEVVNKCQAIGFPVLIRPSFVLGGEGMQIVYSESEVEIYLQDYFVGVETFDKALLIDKFLDNAVEVDVDFITDGTKTYCFIMEQLDKAGVHSGDSASVFPSQNLSRTVMDKLVEMAQKIAKEFQVIGIGNLQCAIKDGEIYIIEVNPRASRTVPFISKCLGFSLAELATNVIMGSELPEFDFDLDYYKNPVYAETLKQKIVHKEKPVAHIAPKFVAIKWPVFCTHKLIGVKPDLGPLMKSTGEAMTVGKTFAEAKAKWGEGRDFANVGVYEV